MATVHLPASLVRLFPGAAQRVELSAESVREVVKQLDQRWPGMWERVCDAGPEIRRHLNVFVDGERAGLDTPVGAASEVRIMTAVSGG